MINLTADYVFCPEYLNGMIKATTGMYDQTQELLAQFKKIENGNVRESIAFVNNVIEFYEEKCNKTFHSYLDKCRTWKGETITTKQLEKVLIVEEALNKTLDDNNIILKLAYQYKSKFDDK